uniref:3FTx-Enh1 n=1 Tax=Pseudoferania polylepis TaxID=338839 RepID=A7X3L3_PSEPL|nr:3FTx-Enh1 [Pseudoferania polylepis]
MKALLLLLLLVAVLFKIERAEGENLKCSNCKRAKCSFYEKMECGKDQKVCTAEYIGGNWIRGCAQNCTYTGTSNNVRCCPEKLCNRKLY